MLPKMAGVVAGVEAKGSCHQIYSESYTLATGGFEASCLSFSPAWHQVASDEGARVPLLLLEAVHMRVNNLKPTLPSPLHFLKTGHPHQLLIWWIWWGGHLQLNMMSQFHKCW